MPYRSRFVFSLLASVIAATPVAAQDATGLPGEEDVIGLPASDREAVEAPTPVQDAAEAPVRGEDAIEVPPDSRDPVGDADVLLRSGYYDAIGIRMGSFVAYPAVEAGSVFVSNVHQSPTDRESDVGAVIAPELRLESDWSRHSLRLSASSSHVRYDANPEEGTDDATVNAAMRLDMTSRTTIDLDGGFELGQEERDSVNVPQGAQSSPEIITWSAGAGLTHRFNRLTASLRGDLGMVDYGATDLGSAGKISNDDQDYVEVAVKLRLGYEVSPMLQPFVEGTYSVREHDLRVDRNGFVRDSDGISVAGGLAVNLGPILRGEVSAGYVRREYDDATLDPAEGPTVSANLTWAPTRLTTIAARGSTSVSETTVAGVSAAIEYAAGLELTHSLSYNLTAKADGSYGHTDYTGTKLADDAIDARASLEYMLSRNVVLKGGYAYRWYQSSEPGSEYDAHSVKLGVRLQQ